MISEIHTSDFAACPRSVQLRHEGKRIIECTTALYVGKLWHEAARIWHETTEHSINGCVLAAVDAVDRQLAEEKMLVSATVKSEYQDHAVQVSKWLARYADIIRPVLDAGYRAYCEVPMRLTLTIDGEDQEFASHLDLLMIHGEYPPLVYDWKTGKDDPSPFYLARNLQFGLYYLAVAHGRLHIDGGWKKINAAPLMRWVQVRNLSPYARATEGTDDNGEKRTFTKGESRPMSKIVRTINIENESNIVSALSDYVRMFRAGIYPMIPDAEGCGYCNSSKWCPRFTGE